MTDQPELIYSSKGKPAMCEVCCAEEGVQHEDYCHGVGVVRKPSEALH